jgi:hypothetical protein
VVDPFPPAISLTFDTSNTALNTCASTAASNPAVSDLCGAIVDVTGSPAQPLYAGHNDADMLFVGSLAKIYTVYVAFWLKQRVETQAKAMIAAGLPTSTSGWQNRVFNELRRAWQPKLNAAFPGLPSGMPRFGDVVVLSTTGDASLAEQSPPLSDADLDAIGENGAPRGKYRDRMRLMLRWSNNTAASNCILPLSYPYINGVLGSAGFFDKATKKGLWLSADYAGHDWVRGAGNPAGQPLTPRWSTLQGRTKSNIMGTASQVARYMTSLALGKLVDAASCTDMISIIRGADGIGSYIQSALASASPPRPFSTVTSKIGFGDDSFSHDCAIVATSKFRLVETVLGSPPAKGRTDLDQLAVAYYDCVAARHP